MEVLHSRSGLLGRLAELATIRDEGHACLIRGAPGVGKTWLGDALLRRLAGEVAALRGRGLPMGGPSLLPVYDALRSAQVYEDTNSGSRTIEGPAQPVPCLEGLLHSLFDASHLHRWLSCLPDGALVRRELPSPNTAMAEQVSALIGVLARRGLLTPAFFHALLQEFPRREQDIGVVARLWGRSGDARTEALIPQEFLHSETVVFMRLSDLIVSLCQERSLVLFFDDVQWLDRSSAGFLSFLIQRLDRVPLFLLMSGRMNGVSSEVVGQLAQSLEQEPHGRMLQITLPPLNGPDIKEALEAILRGPVHLTEDESSWFLTTSRGNPKYLREVVELLVSRGAWVRDGPTWTLNDERRSLVLPPSLYELICGRLEAVLQDANEAEDILVHSAAYGSQFDIGIVARSTGLTERRVLAELSKIERKTGYVRYSSKRGIYEFDHDLTRQAILDRYSGPIAAAHERILRTLTELGTSDERRLAEHSEGAGLFDDAASHYARAASERFVASAFLDAAECSRLQDLALDRLGLNASDPHRLDAIAFATRCLVASERYHEALSISETRVDAARAENHTGLLHAIGMSLSHQADAGAQQAAIRALREAIASVREEEQGSEAFCELMLDLVFAYDMAGDDRQTRECFQRAVSIARAVESPVLRVRMLRLAGMFWQPDKAEDALKKAVQIASEAGAHFEEALCRNNLGVMQLYQRSFTEAEQALRVSSEGLLRFGGFRRDVPTNNLGLISMLRGDLEHADATFREAEHMTLHLRHRISVRTNRAILRVLQGDLATAVDWFRQLADLAVPTGDPYYRLVTRHNLVRALFDAGAVGEAAELSTSITEGLDFERTDLLRAAQAAALVQQVRLAAGRDTDEALARLASPLQVSTRPHRWVFALPYQIADLEFWYARTHW